MFLNRNTCETYWNSYRQLEKQLLRLSHSISFDDNQITVYSSELADIINSACVKIESLAKDIYADHIWPFQLDNAIVPVSYTKGKNKKSADKFKPQDWIRDKWKFDYHCLLEIDNKFLLSKKRIELKTEKFSFLKYGSSILPFGNISFDDCSGGYWEYSEVGSYQMNWHKLEAVDWCKSYQAIKHNYLESIPAHGTVKNAIVALSAFYLLAVYYYCLPSRQFDIENLTDEYQLDFLSELFCCSACNYVLPPSIIDGKQKKQKTSFPASEVGQVYQEVFSAQELLTDIEGYPFLITLNQSAHQKVQEMVDQYCAPKNLKQFDIAPFKKSDMLVSTDADSCLYMNLRQFITPPYKKSNVCITFNIGTNSVYDYLSINYSEYERSKYRNQNEATLSSLRIGDYVDAKFEFNDYVTNVAVEKIEKHYIDFFIQNGDSGYTLSQPKDSIIYIKKHV